MDFGYISLRQWLLEQLSQLVPLKDTTIPLYLLKHADGVIYRSTVASQLARKNHYFQNTGAIAQTLVDNYLRYSAGRLNIQINVTNNQAIDFLVSDRVLGLWLAKVYLLILKDFSVFKHLPQRQETKILSQFSQYSHARCCALLRLGHQQGIITSQGYIQGLEPYPVTLIKLLPSLDYQDKNLLKCLLAIVDEQHCSLNQNWLRLTQNLSLAVLDWERYCGIWRNKPELRGFRCLLIVLAQYYLRFLLEEKLKVTAPIDL